jgi:hypothetical protein
VTHPFLFIVGRGRSGTTLLQAMFDAHPEMAIPPESHLIADMAARRKRYGSGARFSADRFLTDLVPHLGFKNWGLSDMDVAEVLRAARPSSLADAIRVVYAAYARRHGKTRFGEKTPLNVLHIPMIARMFPEARFLHIIRDGRDVTLSYLSQEFGPSTVVESAYRWRQHVGRGRRDGRLLGPGRYREVRYEKVVEDPEAILRDLCGFAGLGFDERMLRYQEHRERVLPQVLEGWHPGLELPPTKGLRDWRKDMSARQVALFEAVAGDLLAQLDYERAVPRPTPVVRLAALRDLAVFQARRLAGKLRSVGRRRWRTAGGTRPEKLVVG